MKPEINRTEIRCGRCGSSLAREYSTAKVRVLWARPIAFVDQAVTLHCERCGHVTTWTPAGKIRYQAQAGNN